MGKSPPKLLNNLADRRCSAIEVKTLQFIERGAPRRSNEDDYASILREVIPLKQHCIVAVDNFDLLTKNREVAISEIKHLRVGLELERDALRIRQVPKNPKECVARTRERV